MYSQTERSGNHRSRHSDISPERYPNQSTPSGTYGLPPSGSVQSSSPLMTREHQPQNARERDYYDPARYQDERYSPRQRSYSRTSSQMNEWSNGNSRPSTALNGEPHYAQQSRSNQGNGVKQSSGSSSHPPGAPRLSNPMSMSNLLSDSVPETTSKANSPRLNSAPRRSSQIESSHDRQARQTTPQQPRQVKDNTKSAPLSSPKVASISTKPDYSISDMSGPPNLTVAGTEQAYLEIEQQDLSDVEGPGFERSFDQWASRSKKRVIELEYQESVRRKRRRMHVLTSYQEMFTQSSELAKEIFVIKHEHEAEDNVRSRDVEDEKERKKDMQRKRRRERTLQNETAKRDEAMERLQTLDDEEQRSRILKDVQRAGKKIKTTEDLLQGKPEDSPQDDVEVDASPPPDEPTSSRPKRIIKPSSRLKKSKEQKQAEIDNAVMGQAMLDAGADDLNLVDEIDDTVIAEIEPKSSKRRKPTKEIVPYTSKGYNQIYEQIWRDLARNHINKVFRVRHTSIDVRMTNIRKTAQLAAKEARRWQIKTTKAAKDVQARAKRSMREMLSFWKRNERDERDQRKLAEKQELENARKAEADREAARQKRKLNFLISQTELYSHFIGKKVKTDELERSSNDVVPTGEIIVKDPTHAHTVDLPPSNAKLGTKVTNFDELDFDAEDETALRQAAMTNAQIAVQEAQDRARAFNNDGQAQSDFDDGEMNFQNPSSLQTTDVTQPKMLTCELKEYQLKGLNWLVNLYEQGINGILADEMGLGKTVQSISVMSYLAEVHNIWGPFLVVAPASTLHNWQQEIAKFVPTLKVLPYWGNAKDRKVLRKFWDRKHITYNRESSFHVLVTSYQLVVQDAIYFQKIKWQYMILDEAQAIKSSQSSRWKALLGFHCRNRLLLTGTPIQNNMQELWALLHFIMPSLFDSHDEFSEWFSKDIESHAQSNTQLNEDQLKRLHMILKPFMLRRVKKHVQKELGDKVELDVYCDLTYRQRAYYTSLRNKISFADLIERAAVGDEGDAATLMNLVMQFRKVCNHPDLFERADVSSPFSLSTWAETASFMREGFNINVSYSVKNSVDYWLPKRLASGDGRIDLPGSDNIHAGWRQKHLKYNMSIWDAENIRSSDSHQASFSWLRFIDQSASDLVKIAHGTTLDRIMHEIRENSASVDADDYTPAHSMLKIIRQPLSSTNDTQNLLKISRMSRDKTGFDVIERCTYPRAQAPPVELVCPSQQSLMEKQTSFFNVPLRRALYPIKTSVQAALLKSKVPPSQYPISNLLPAPDSQKQRYTKIEVPSMRRFVSDCGKLAKLDELLVELKAGGHRVLLYFQMTRMIDMMEEYLTYRNYRYCRLDGSTKLEDRRDTVAAFQSSDEIFVFLLSTRAGGLGINLTSADTVIFYDSDWNPTIDSQAMDRAHRLGQKRQVTVYRLITRGTIEERIRKRALQKEEVQRVVISGGAPAGGEKIVDFNNRTTRENRTKDIALWLADDEQAAAIEKKEAELAEQESKDPSKKRKKTTGGASRKKEISMDDMYHEGEGKFDDGGDSNKPSGAATPVVNDETSTPAATKKKGTSKKAKTLQQRLAVADGQVG